MHCRRVVADPNRVGAFISAVAVCSCTVHDSRPAQTHLSNKCSSKKFARSASCWRCQERPEMAREGPERHRTLGKGQPEVLESIRRQQGGTTIPFAGPTLHRVTSKVTHKNTAKERADLVRSLFDGVCYLSHRNHLARLNIPNGLFFLELVGYICIIIGDLCPRRVPRRLLEIH